MPPDSDTDRDILELVDRGDIDRAARLMMDRHGGAIYRFCYSLLRDQALTDDVHQQVFIEAVRDLKRGKFEGRSKLRTWLYGIARHRVMDKRKPTTENTKIDHEVPTEMADPAPLADQLIDDARLEQALLECLDELPEDSRFPVMLRYGHRMTYEEMAKIFDEKPGTLQARVARAMETLRKCIDRQTGG